MAIWYESGEEYRLFQILERTKKVIWYQEQPLKIPYHFKGKNRLYYPDAIVVTDEGRGVVVEVKMLQGMVEEMTLVKALAAIEHLHKRGLGYLLVDARGRSLRTLADCEPNEPVEQKVLHEIDARGELKHQAYWALIEDEDFKMMQFMSLVVRHDLSFTRFPFRLARLKDGLTFKSLI